MVKKQQMGNEWERTNRLDLAQAKRFWHLEKKKDANSFNKTLILANNLEMVHVQFVYKCWWLIEQEAWTIQVYDKSAKIISITEISAKNQ